MKFYRLSDATFYCCINILNINFLKPFLDKKCIFLRDMESIIQLSKVCDIVTFRFG